MFNFHKDHRKLVITALLVFVFLSTIIAIVPSYQMQDVEPLPQQEELSEEAIKGLQVYISEGCVACHTQQVRNIEMDNVWGSRPSMPSDYYYSKQRMNTWQQSPSLLGSERTGPDLTNIGNRQPGASWHLLHFYNPRIVVKESIMPAYSYLFEHKNEDEVQDDETIVDIPSEFLKEKGKVVVPTEKVKNLIAYMQSLKQTELPSAKDFIPAKKQDSQSSSSSSNSDEDKGLDGKLLYSQVCSACHQENGEGLKGAFPPLKGSAIVTKDNPELLIKIILQGYDARSDYGQMPGFATQLSDAEIAAIASHERNAWGNSAARVSEEEVKKIREMVMEEAKNKEL
ncbi:cbb3-type cytochrome c oxidase subunit II [Marivirga sp.]|uniref:cbb3-type cytochrome c oxidase subunit II n=1 Tax=Marivirga sp. TaxID=2018662 RepID=UPI002D7EB3D6|nr:cbb3-type cytochrome c oxidase subunit II [Marivirga sp.]HET8860950.1 cbb3-type cytochrome c oxidase subunit II [Marivirga sp.]